MMINYQSLIILSLIFPHLPRPCIKAQTSPSNYHQLQVDIWETNNHSPTNHAKDISKQQMEVASIHSPEDTPHQVLTTKLRTWRPQNPSHFHRYLSNTHGILNIIGWGTLLPIGAIAARYFKKFPFKCNEWYSVHVACQSGGGIAGTVGWILGMMLGHSSKQQTNTTHRTLGIIIFTFSTIQMLVMFRRPKDELKFPKYLKIFHFVVGYALIALSIANIFEGIKNKSHAPKWKWPYVGVLGVLGVTALGLEIFKWIRYTMQQAVELNSNMYTP